MSTEPRFSSSRVPRLDVLVFVTAVLVIAGLAALFGVPLFRQQRAIQVIQQGGGWVETRKHGPEWLRRWIGGQTGR